MNTAAGFDFEDAGLHGDLESSKDSELDAVNFGVIGFEPDYVAVKIQALAALPEERWEGLLISTQDGLMWYPPTEYGSQFT